VNKTQRREFHRAIRAVHRQVRERDSAAARAARYNATYRLIRAIDAALTSCPDDSPQRTFLVSVRGRVLTAQFTLDQAYAIEQRAIQTLTDLIG
jgi:uncharacterized membrane protein